jgi:hypothetical protein
MPRVGRPVGRREEEARNAKATRSRDLAESRSLESGGNPFNGNFPTMTVCYAHSLADDKIVPVRRLDFAVVS